MLNVGQREQDVRDLRREIADMLRLIQRLKGDLETLIRKVGITYINTLRVQAWAHILSAQPASLFLSIRKNP